MTYRENGYDSITYINNSLHLCKKLHVIEANFELDLKLRDKKLCDLQLCRLESTRSLLDSNLLRVHTGTSYPARPPWKILITDNVLQSCLLVVIFFCSFEVQSALNEIYSYIRFLIQLISVELTEITLFVYHLIGSLPLSCPKYNEKPG